MEKLNISKDNLNNNVSGSNLQNMMSMSSPSHTPSPEDFYKKVTNYSDSNFINLDKNGYVKMKTIQKGIGSKKPVNGNEITAHYIGELPDGRNVDNTYISKEAHQFILGGNSIVYGLELAIKNMTIGEKAVVVIEPEYGYIPLENYKKKLSDKKYVDDSKFDFSNLFYDIDKANNSNKKDDGNKDESNKPNEGKDKNKEIDGKKSFLSLEPSEAKKYSVIIYEVELMLIDKEARKQKSSLSTEEKLSIANELKAEGNASFKGKYYHEAIVYFSNALDYLTQIPSDDMIKILDAKLSLILNTVNCLIHLNSYQYALNKVEEAFKIKVNIKCFYYRAIARMHLAEFELAEKDISKLVDYCVDETVLNELRSRLKRTRDDYMKNTSKIYRSSNLTSLYEDRNIVKNSVLNKDNNINDYSYNYIGNDNKFFSFPKFNKDNKAVYLDVIKNSNTKNPIKLKFETFKDTWADELILFLSGNNNNNKFIYYNKDKNTEISSLSLIDKKILILTDKEKAYTEVNKEKISTYTYLLQK